MGKTYDVARAATAVVEGLVQCGKTFTAYTVTQKLRSAFSGENIDHPSVKAAVHGVMVAHVRNDYDFTIDYFDGAPAMVYFKRGTTPDLTPLHKTPTACGATQHVPTSQSPTVTAPQAATPAPTPPMPPKKYKSKLLKRPPQGIKMIPVSSSAISHVGYNVDDANLILEFHGGRIYMYAGVDAETFAHLVTSDSIGKAYNALIKFV